MAISVEDIKKLRDMTGAGMMKAKGALEAANGDFDKAIEELRKSGAASAEKKADREAREGVVEGYVHSGRIGVLVEINCETDFVARTEDFKTFARDIAMHIAAANPLFLSPEQVPAEAIESEKRVYVEDTKGKPEEIAAKIVDGKLAKYYENTCLTKQAFIKDPEKSIEDLTKELIAKLGENIVIRQFKRMELGSL
jgi:elongation factor Ts